MDIAGYILWGLLVTFLLALAGGMFFGLLRGPKRTAKRLVVLLFFFLLALLITPFISRIFVKVVLKFKIKGKTVHENIVNLLPDMAGSALETMPEFEAFALGLPIIVVNIIIFVVLLLLFRYVVSPIFSKLLLHKVAPKYDENGMKIPYSKLAGLGVGAVFGLVIFTFTLIPALGLISSLDKIDNYTPRVDAAQSVDFLDTGIPALDTVNKGINDVNGEVQKSPIGLITKYSGLQWVGGIGFGYLTNVKSGDTTINVKRDTEVFFELSRDIATVISLAGDIQSGHDLIPVFDSAGNIAYFERIVNKALRLGVARMVLNSEFHEFLRKEDLLREESLTAIANDPQSYKEAIYTGLGNLNANFVREDLLAMIEMMRLIFARHQLPGITQRVSLYEDIDNAVLALNVKLTPQNPNITVIGLDGLVTVSSKAEAVTHAFDRLERTLTSVKFSETTGRGARAVVTERNLAEQILYDFGNMNIFKKLLLDSDNPELHSMPLGKILGVDPGDAEIEDFGKVMEGLAGIFVRTLQVGSEIYTMTSGDMGDGTAFVGDLMTSGVLDTLGDILGILLNKDDYLGKDGNHVKVMGTGPLLRGFIARELEQKLDGDNLGPFADLRDGLIGLFDAENNVWVFEIKAVVANFVQDIIDDTLSSTPIRISLGRNNTQRVAVMDIMFNMVFGKEGFAVWAEEFRGGNFESIDDLTNMLGGPDGVRALRDAGMRITIEVDIPTLPPMLGGKCLYCLFEEYASMPEVDPVYLMLIKDMLGVPETCQVGCENYGH